MQRLGGRRRRGAVFASTPAIRRRPRCGTSLAKIRSPLAHTAAEPVGLIAVITAWNLSAYYYDDQGCWERWPAGCFDVVKRLWRRSSQRGKLAAGRMRPGRLWHIERRDCDGRQVACRGDTRCRLKATFTAPIPTGVQGVDGDGRERFGRRRWSLWQDRMWSFRR